MNAYQKELKRKRDNYSHDQYIIEQGLELGKLKAKQETAIKMLLAEESLDKIMDYTNLTRERQSMTNVKLGGVSTSHHFGYATGAHTNCGTLIS